jgi:hypothetical protein
MGRYVLADLQVAEQDGLGAAPLLWPVQLMFRHARRLAVLDGFGPPGLVAAAVPADLLSEHDHMIVSDSEVRVPSAVWKQRPGKPLSECIAHIIIRLEIKDRPHRRLGRRYRLREVLPVQPRQSQTRDAQVSANSQAFGQQGSFEHEPSFASGPDFAREPAEKNQTVIQARTHYSAAALT